MVLEICLRRTPQRQKIDNNTTIIQNELANENASITRGRIITRRTKAIRSTQITPHSSNQHKNYKRLINTPFNILLTPVNGVKIIQSRMASLSLKAHMSNQKMWQGHI